MFQFPPNFLHIVHDQILYILYFLYSEAFPSTIQFYVVSISCLNNSFVFDVLIKTNSCGAINSTTNNKHN